MSAVVYRTRTPLVWLCVLGFVLSAGCARLFDIDVPPVKHVAGTGGTELGGAGDVGLEAGGSSPGGSGADTEGGAAGRAAAGRAGNSAGGRGNGGSGGSDAAAGGSPFGELNAPCAEPGAVACPSALATSWVICKDGRWQQGPSCGQDEYCDRRDGRCAAVYSLQCHQRGPFHQYCTVADPYGWQFVTCGPDLVSADATACMFDCQDRTGCSPPTDDEVVLEPESPPIATDRAYWPTPNIPVCVTNPDEPEWASVKDEVARTWGRYAGIAFTGWDACDPSATGVIASLMPHSEPCAGWLGSIDRVGYPGPGGSVHVSICTRYNDASDQVQPVSDGLLRLVARHEFAHVLGFADAGASNSTVDFMARGLYTSELGLYTFSALDIGMLTEAYGRKPAGALVDARGDCLTLANGVLDFTSCDASAAQTFTFAHGELVHPDTAECLAAVPADAAAVAACAVDAPATVNQAWQPAATQIRGFGGECLQVVDADSGEGGAGGAVAAALAVNVCPDFDTPSALWSLESVDDGTRVRLRVAGGADCVTARSDTLALTLEACDDCAETDPTCASVDRFTVNDAGQIRFGGYCFEAPDYETFGHGDSPDSGLLKLDPCSLAPSMLWNLSGRIESAAGMALTRPLDAGALLLTASPVGDGSPDAQIFDFYFSDSTP